jgi:hypothetical protein
VMITMTTSATTEEMTDAMIDVARTTTITTTTTRRNELHRHRQKGAIPMPCVSEGQPPQQSSSDQKQQTDPIKR